MVDMLDAAKSTKMMSSAMKRATAYDRDIALDAAMNLFWERGFHATSWKDLEGVLNMKPGSIYAAFTSKENLYLLALERYFESNRSAFHAALEETASPLEVLADFYRSFARLADGHPAKQACMLMRTQVDTRSTEPVISAKTLEYMRSMQDEFAGAFEKAKELGEIAPDADAKRLARRFQANVTALRMELNMGSDHLAVEQLAEDMVQELEHLRRPET